MMSEMKTLPTVFQREETKEHDRLQTVVLLCASQEHIGLVVRMTDSGYRG